MIVTALSNMCVNLTDIAYVTERKWSIFITTVTNLDWYQVE